jgi:hypothetical protein
MIETGLALFGGVSGWIVTTWMTTGWRSPVAVVCVAALVAASLGTLALADGLRLGMVGLLLGGSSLLIFRRALAARTRRTPPPRRF